MFNGPLGGEVLQRSLANGFTSAPHRLVYLAYSVLWAPVGEGLGVWGVPVNSQGAGWDGRLLDGRVWA